MPRYLVELAQPDAGWQDVRALADRARAASGDLTTQGEHVRFLRAIYLPEDGTCALLLEGDSAAAVREAGRRAGGLVARMTPTQVLEEA